MFVESAAINSLEIDKIVSLVAKHCRSELGVNAAHARLRNGAAAINKRVLACRAQTDLKAKSLI